VYRVSLANVGAQRTCKPLYERHQATPVATFLDPAEVGNIFTGMVLRKSDEDLVRLCNATQRPFGLAAFDKNATINDLDGLNISPVAVWQGGPDAYFQIDDPAFDSAQAYAVPTTGAKVPLFSNATGQITSVDGTGPEIGELIEVVSSKRIIIRLHLPIDTP
jgi:hypothetical protein